MNNITPPSFATGGYITFNNTNTATYTGGTFGNGTYSSVDIAPKYSPIDFSKWEIPDGIVLDEEHIFVKMSDETWLQGVPTEFVIEAYTQNTGVLVSVSDFGTSDFSEFFKAQNRDAVFIPFDQYLFELL